MHRTLQGPDFVVIGHRGAAGLAPENTLKSFALALQWRCPMVELDVYRTRDAAGETHLAVIHDDTVDRTTNGSGQVERLSLEQLRQLDAGAGESIPLLDEVTALLDSYRGAPRPVGVNIELKGPGTAAPTAEFIAQHPQTPVLVSSFEHAQLDAFRALDAATPVAPLYDRWQRNWRQTADRLSASAVNISVRIATPARIGSMRSAGFGVLVYTVNDPQVAHRLKAWGVNGIFTDRPDRMAEAGLIGD